MILTQREKQQAALIESQAQEIARLRDAGTAMAKMALDWSGRAGYALTAKDGVHLRRLHKQWEAALSQSLHEKG